MKFLNRLIGKLSPPRLGEVEPKVVSMHEWLEKRSRGEQ